MSQAAEQATKLEIQCWYLYALECYAITRQPRDTDTNILPGRIIQADYDPAEPQYIGTGITTPESIGGHGILIPLDQIPERGRRGMLAMLRRPYHAAV